MQRLLACNEISAHSTQTIQKNLQDEEKSVVKKHQETKLSVFNTVAEPSTN